MEAKQTPLIDLRAALAQQAEPTVTEDMKSAVRWAPSSAYWSQRLREFFGPDAREGIDALERRLAKAQQAEPLNLADPAVRKRLASQWGYVPAAAQAEPVEPVAWVLDGTSVVEFYREPYHNGPEWTPLCKCADTPPQRKPLTEQEIESCRQQGYAHAGLSAPFDFGKAARAVERKVRGE